MRRYFLLIAASILTLACTDKKEQLQGEWMSSITIKEHYPFLSSSILEFRGDSVIQTVVESSLLKGPTRDTFAFKLVDNRLIFDSKRSSWECLIEEVSENQLILTPDYDSPEGNQMIYHKLKKSRKLPFWSPKGKSFSTTTPVGELTLNFFENDLLTTHFFKGGEHSWKKGIWKTTTVENRQFLITQAPFVYTFVLDSLSSTGAYFSNYDEIPQQLYFTEYVPQRPNQLLGKWRNTQFEQQDDLYYLTQLSTGKHIQSIEITQDSIRIYSPVAPSTNPFSISGNSNLIVRHLRKDSANLVERMSAPKNPFNIQRKTNQLWFIQELKENRLVLQFETGSFDIENLVFERIP